MDNKIFNTTFEVAMRLLLMLSTTENVSRTIDNLVIADFITNYAKEFGIADSNLHGDNEFSFTEIAARRNIANKAIKSLVLDNFITVSQCTDGFHYTVSELGRNFCNSLTSDYANEYRLFAYKTNTYMKSKSESELLSLISQKATETLIKG